MSVPFMGPEAFGDFVFKLFRRNWPDRRVDLAGPLSLVVDGRSLGLENLFRMCRQDPDRAVDIVEHYFDRLLEGDAIGAIPMPFAVARHRIMPRIQPESIFEQMDRELVAHVPFVNGTVIVFVIDLPHVTVSVTTEQMVRWGIQPEELEEVARQNLARYSPDLRVQVVDSNEGGRAALVSMQDGYDAARLLLNRLHQRLAPELKGDFYVATPARDMFLALTCDPPEFVTRLQSRVERDFQRLPYPITSSFFIVTRDGVAGTSGAEAA